MILIKERARLLETLSIAHGDGRFPKLVQQLVKTDLLVLDDWGLEKMSLSQRNEIDYYTIAIS